MTDQVKHFGQDSLHGTNPSQRRKSKRVNDPFDFFSSWSYNIGRHHFKYLGMEFRDFVVNKKTQSSWAIWWPLSAEIPEGTLFYQKHDGSKFLQVLADWDAFRVEVHEGDVSIPNSIYGWAIKHAQLTEWLSSGLRPFDAIPVDLSNSKSGIIAWQLNRPLNHPT